jgi:hypothetical protein
MRDDYGCVGVAYRTPASPPTDSEEKSMSQAGAVQSSRGIQLDVGTLLARARQAAGLTDFGDEDFLEHLAHTVAIINAEAGSGPTAAGGSWLVGMADGCNSSNLKRHPPSWTRGRGGRDHHRAAAVAARCCNACCVRRR